MFEHIFSHGQLLLSHVHVTYQLSQHEPFCVWVLGVEWVWLRIRMWWLMRKRVQEWIGCNFKTVTIIILINFNLYCNTLCTLPGVMNPWYPWYLTLDPYPWLPWGWGVGVGVWSWVPKGLPCHCLLALRMKCPEWENPSHSPLSKPWLNPCLQTPSWLHNHNNHWIHINKSYAHVVNRKISKIG